jgi:hypothetical protein
MGILWASTELLKSILQASYKYLIIFLWTSYEFFQTTCKFITNFLLASNELLISILQASYEFLTNFWRASYRASYRHLTGILQASYKYLIIFLWTSYEFFQTSCKFLTNFLWAYYELFMSILQTSCKHLIILLWMSYGHLRNILLSSYKHLILSQTFYIYFSGRGSQDKGYIKLCSKFHNITLNFCLRMFVKSFVNTATDNHYFLAKGFRHYKLF